jgi:hypothetical protein
MNTLHVNRYALGVIAIAILAGCGSQVAPTGGAPAAQSRMHRSSSLGMYLYVSANEAITVLTYPEGELVRTLPSAAYFCTNPNSGELYVVDADDFLGGELDEYTPGGASLIGDESLPTDYIWGGCAVDPITGNVAIATGKQRPGKSDIATVLVYNHALRLRKHILDQATEYFSNCGYDDKGNLFLDGLTFAELPAKGHSIINISLNLVAEGTVEWDGTDITLNSMALNSGEGVSLIFRVAVNGSRGTVVGKTKLGRRHQFPALTWIQGNVAMSPWKTPKHERGLGFWNYPEGGKEPYQVIPDLSHAYSVTTGVTGRQR